MTAYQSVIECLNRRFDRLEVRLDEFEGQLRRIEVGQMETATRLEGLAWLNKEVREHGKQLSALSHVGTWPNHIIALLAAVLAAIFGVQSR